MASSVPVTVAYGDGIGPEIMEATLFVLEQAGAKLDVEEIEVGKAVYEAGHTAGIRPEAWDSLRRTKVFLKAPITTPQGGGMKSLNVTIRKSLGLYANVRPCISYDPFVRTKHPHIDTVIIRENEEDLYAGIEHRQTDEVYQALKLITRPGCERIVRFAFEYTRHRGREKLTCFTKDNILKLTDGLFHRVFDEIARDYPEIETEHMIVDIGMARMAETPEEFDAVVVPNLYGDILSDVAAQLTGSVGLGGSANLGDGGAMFEAVHGSAPDIAGKGVANPSGLLLAAVQMLDHIDQPDVAQALRNAWLKTLEDGIHTADIYNEATSKHMAGTTDFARSVVERLGQLPRRLRKVAYEAKPVPMPAYTRRPPAKKELVGVDVFLDWTGAEVETLAAQLQRAAAGAFELALITNRGVKVWPDGFPETFCTDHWRCRFMGAGGSATHAQVVSLLSALEEAGLDFIKSEHLYDFDGEPGYSLGQGQ